MSLLGHLKCCFLDNSKGSKLSSLSLAASVKQLHQYVRLDAAMWHRFLTEWNGVALFTNQEMIKAVDFTLYTDAAATVGYGGFL